MFNGLIDPLSSISISAPVIEAAKSDSKKAANAPISDGLIMRPMGMLLVDSAITSWMLMSLA